MSNTASEPYDLGKNILAMGEGMTSDTQINVEAIGIGEAEVKLLGTLTPNSTFYFTFNDGNQFMVDPGTDSSQGQVTIKLTKSTLDAMNDEFLASIDLIMRKVAVSTDSISVVAALLSCLKINGLSVAVVSD